MSTTYLPLTLTETVNHLLFSLNVLVHKLACQTAYSELLIDIAEGFGVGILVLVLSIGSIATSSRIHGTTASLRTNNLASLVSYKSFLSALTR